MPLTPVEAQDALQLTSSSVLERFRRNGPSSTTASGPPHLAAYTHAAEHRPGPSQLATIGVDAKVQDCLRSLRQRGGTPANPDDSMRASVMPAFRATSVSGPQLMPTPVVAPQAALVPSNSRVVRSLRAVTPAGPAGRPNLDHRRDARLPLSTDVYRTEYLDAAAFNRR